MGQNPEYSDVECEDCGDLIPAKRLKVLPYTTTCVGCMETREDKGQGTKRHTMAYNVTMHGDDIDTIETSIIRTEK